MAIDKPAPTKKIPPPVLCTYWHLHQYFNRGGALPCGECPACLDARESLERVKAWNAATDAGADPRR